MVHRIESRMLDEISGVKIQYSTWQEQAAGIKSLLGEARRIAMQYSPNCAIPYVSLVDAGTIELVRSAGGEISSSAELVQYFEARRLDAPCGASRISKLDAVWIGSANRRSI